MARRLSWAFGQDSAWALPTVFPRPRFQHAWHLVSAGWRHLSNFFAAGAALHWMTPTLEASTALCPVEVSAPRAPLYRQKPSLLPSVSQLLRRASTSENSQFERKQPQHQAPSFYLRHRWRVSWLGRCFQCPSTSRPWRVQVEQNLFHNLRGRVVPVRKFLDEGSAQHSLEERHLTSWLNDPNATKTKCPCPLAAHVYLGSRRLQLVLKIVHIPDGRATVHRPSSPCPTLSGAASQGGALTATAWHEALPRKSWERLHLSEDDWRKTSNNENHRTKSTSGAKLEF